MTEKKYMNTVYYGNDELVYLTTRALFYDKQKNIISINKNRYVDELKLYKHLKKKGVGSLLSSLIPIILVNNSIETSFAATSFFFQWIKKGITVEEYASIYLLCTLVQNNTIEKDDIFNITHNNIFDKQDTILLERLKINLILQFESIVIQMLTFLEPVNLSYNENLLLHLNEETTQTPNRMCEYFLKLKNHQINAPDYQGNFDIGKIFNLNQGDCISDSLLGQLSVSSKSENELELETKRGIVVLCRN